MNLPTEIFGSVIVVHTPDELSAEQAPGLEAFLRTIEPRQVVLDMDQTELLDSVGLSSLLDAQDELRERGGDVKVATNSGSNRKILEITRLDQQLEVFDTVVDAVKSYH